MTALLGLVSFLSFPGTGLLRNSGKCKAGELSSARLCIQGCAYELSGAH
jgi:hypothetical protein